VKRWRRSVQCDGGDECLVDRLLRAIDDNATESKEAKAHTLAKMRDKKDVSWCPLTNGSNQTRTNFRKGWGGTYPKREYITQENIPVANDPLSAWNGSGIGYSEGNKATVVCSQSRS
jgi:hypothetical protein